MGRPWDHLITPELEQKEGHYVDYAAYEIWLAGVGEGLIRDTMEDAEHGGGTSELVALYVAIAEHADRLTDAACEAKCGPCGCEGRGIVERRRHNPVSGETQLDGFDDCPVCAPFRRELAEKGKP